MKFTEFTYTKKSGDASQRAVVIVQEPNRFLQGIDVSELDNDDLGDFVQELRALEDRHLAERMKLMQDFDLRHSFRQFDPELVSDQTVEWV